MSQRSQAVSTVQLDNEQVIVTEWRFAPGTETGHHHHRYDYVVVPMTDGTLLMQTAEGEKHSQLVAGQAYFRKAGIKHNVINASDHEVVFVETEIK
ncbi:cupin domain-containing protein [Pseudomonas guineae]|uniref:cupin domain-containing protein n=1 Tax=Pseudomonas guineae TaxID=425504 RepID=UPI003D01C4E1